VSLPVVVTPTAERHLVTIDGWWRRHREAAANLFIEEFAASVNLIQSMPLAGRRYGAAPIDGVRRVLLRSSRFHVYYQVRTSEIVILAVWSALRGRDPDLRA